MGRYDNEDYPGVSVARQKDFVLAMNEYCYVLNKTSGKITTRVGPTTITTSAQDALIVFNTKTKKFEEISDFEKAKKLFVSAPEGWYVILKNPAENGSHPPIGMSENPEIVVGKKVNISGPISFPLYAGQMAKVVRGHKLRSNQYLLARVYDADAAKESTSTMVDINGNEIEDKKNDYFVGQLMIIKGTEISFYIPPTGIEIIPQTPYGDDYVRDAVTLERLEYVILKDEDGEKRYVHGPAVVFPKPTETFTSSKKNSVIFRALELSPISGIYVKVIADYKDDNGTEHKTGEELFITGNDQMIYYPRPEHAMIQYDGKYMHHAIAIPAGEGRYILNRLTGEIKTIAGPRMYLPDPRTEVVVRRKLSANDCALMFPGNTEAMLYNAGLTEKAMENAARKGTVNSTDAINNAYATANQEATLAIFEANSNISRGVSYTKPRTITLDTKYEGVVSIDVWSGFAINVISKSGESDIVVGPTTRLLDYDETLEAIKIGGTTTAFLPISDNKIEDTITVQTSDFVDFKIKLEYSMKFLKDFKDRWFNIDDIEGHLKDKLRILIKNVARKYTVDNFYKNYESILRNEILNGTDDASKDKNASTGRTFSENGMFINDVNVSLVSIEKSVAELLNSHQANIIQQTINLADAELRTANEKKIIALEKETAEKRAELDKYKAELDQIAIKERIARESERKALYDAQEKASKEAEKELQTVLDAIQAAKLARDKKADDAKIETEKALANIEKTKQEAYAATVAKIMASVGPDLTAALSATANESVTRAIASAVSPYSMAKGESISKTVDTLLRGTPFDKVIRDISDNSTVE